MKKYILLILLFWQCSPQEEKCGDIIDKVIINGNYYFVMNAANSVFIGSPDDLTTYLPDGAVSGQVSENVYNNFDVGDEYCH